MAKRAKSTRPESRELSVAGLQNAITKIDRRINDLKSFDVNTITERSGAKVTALEKKINGTLADIFGHDTVEYQDHRIWSLTDLPLIMGATYPLHEVKPATQKGIGDAVIKLESLKETLQEKLEDKEGALDEIAAFHAKPPEGTATIANREIFIVHGHDEAAKESVARFIEKLDLNPVILHERPNEGRTVIEKFEDHTNVGFAVVLMTPDDVGASVDDKDNLEPRARQNVILELGFFLGKLGRKQVCALYKDVKIPSDYDGVLYISMDKQRGWQLQLAKEIKAAGIKIDLNKVV